MTARVTNGGLQSVRLARHHLAAAVIIVGIAGCTSSERSTTRFNSPPFVAPVPPPPPNRDYVVHFPPFVGTGFGVEIPPPAPSSQAMEPRACAETEVPCVSIARGGSGSVRPLALVATLLRARINACLPLAECWSGVDFVVTLDVHESGRVSLSGVESAGSFPSVTECLHRTYDGLDIRTIEPRVDGQENWPTAPGSVVQRASLHICPKRNPDEKKAPQS